MRFLRKLTTSDAVSFYSAGITSAANYILSNEKLIAHAVVTCGGSMVNSLSLYLSLRKILDTYDQYNEPLDKETCGLDDRHTITTKLPCFYSVINVTLIAIYTMTAVYEGDKDPSETHTAIAHNWLAVISIALPWLLNKLVERNYYLKEIPNVKKFDNLNHIVDCGNELLDMQDELEHIKLNAEESKQGSISNFFTGANLDVKIGTGKLGGMVGRDFSSLIITPR